MITARQWNALARDVNALWGMRGVNGARVTKAEAGFALDLPASSIGDVTDWTLISITTALVPDNVSFAFPGISGLAGVMPAGNYRIEYVSGFIIYDVENVIEPIYSAAAGHAFVHSFDPDQEAIPTAPMANHIEVVDRSVTSRHRSSTAAEASLAGWAWEFRHTGGCIALIFRDTFYGDNVFRDNQGVGTQPIFRFRRITSDPVETGFF